MALTSELMAKGAAAGLASRLGMGGVNAVAKAVGTTKATATAMLPGFNIFAIVSSGTAAGLPAAEIGAPVLVYNGGSNTLAVYTVASGTDVINAGSAGASFSVTAGKSCLFWPAGQTWIANLSA